MILILTAVCVTSEFFLSKTLPQRHFNVRAETTCNTVLCNTKLRDGFGTVLLGKVTSAFCVKIERRETLMKDFGIQLKNPFGMRPEDAAIGRQTVPCFSSQGHGVRTTRHRRFFVAS
jgi:hypothetical protein